jgi:hypothetical protein
VSLGADDSARAKERRQKIIAAVGGVILVAMLLIQGPTLLKVFSGSAEAAPPPSEASPLPGRAEPASEAARPSSLAAVLAAERRRPVANVARLWQFDRFDYKDPFAEPRAKTRRKPDLRRGAERGTGPSRRRAAQKLRYTVIVHSLPVSVGRRYAESVARRVAIRLKRRVRVLRSSSQRSLRPGYYVIHTGSYRTRAAASRALRAAQRVNRRAYAQYIRP